MSELVYQDSHAELWLGDSLDSSTVEEVMAGREADALIVDAPYSGRTHEAHNAGALTADRARGFAASPAPSGSNKRHVRKYAGKRGLRDRAKITYNPWDESHVMVFMRTWTQRTKGWACSLTDHELFPHWVTYAQEAGRCTFAPLPFVETGSRVRMAGDGPSSWTCWVSVSRPRGLPYSKWGALRGAYVLPGERYFNATEKEERIIGGKPVKGMLLLVEDYSRHGDLVVDPCCGSGTTGVAAKILGRRFIGIDTNREHLDIASRRLAKAREQVRLPGVDAGEQLGWDEL